MPRQQMKRGGEMITQTKTSWLLIQIASAKSHTQIVDLLIESSSDAMACNKEQNTPLIFSSVVLMRVLRVKTGEYKLRWLLKRVVLG
ncbi:hypothetical protein HDV62DRAFT_371277 [Trichoderma sp. SZMC 28011]